MFLPHFWSLLNRQTATWNLFVLNNKETSYYSFFLCQNHSTLFKSQPSHILVNTKKAIWCNLFSIQNEEISLNCNWCRKLYPTVNLTQMEVQWKLTAKAELNCKIHKMLEKSSQFFVLPKAKPCQPKSLAVTWNIAGVKRIWSENL